jgi:tetrahydromethanopterin S-methyltransferase subunit G
VDLAKGCDPIIERNENASGQTSQRQAGMTGRVSAGKLAGIIVGCVVVAVMLFMMVAILSGLFSGEQ